MANRTISIHADQKYTVGFVVRTTRTRLRKVTRHVLSRKSGKWIEITRQQFMEQDIPVECLFAVDDLPKSTDSAPTENGDSGKPFTT